MTTEAQLIVDSRQIVAGHGHRTRRHADRRHPALARVRVQRDAGAAASCRARHRAARLVRAAPAAGRRAARSAPRRFPGVPFMFEYFHRESPGRTAGPAGSAGSSPRGAAASRRRSAAFLDRFGVKIHSFYGASESGGISYDDSDEVDAAIPSAGRCLASRSLSAPTSTRLLERAAFTCEARAWRRGYVGETAEEFCDGGFLTGDYGAFDARRDA